MLSDDDLIKYIDKILRLDKTQLYKVEILDNGKILHVWQTIKKLTSF